MPLATRTEAPQPSAYGLSSGATSRSKRRLRVRTGTVPDTPTPECAGSVGALLAAATGALQGVIIGGWNANSIIVTIAASAILEGLAIWFSNGVTINPVGTDYRLLNERFLGLPVGVYALVVLALAGEALMRLTVFGRLIHLAGDCRAAARAAALPLTWIGTGVFAIAGACAGLAGPFMASFNHSASLPLNRGTFGYDAIAAVLIGGAAIGGGRGTILRTMLGVVVISIVTDLVLLRGYSTARRSF